MYQSFVHIRQALKDGQTTLPDLVAMYLNKIHELNPRLNAFIESFDNEAQQQAQQIDQKLSDGTAGRLAGMVIGLKDNILYKDHCCSAASRMLQDFKSPYHASVVERLLSEDAIIIGRLNCDEFAMGNTNSSSCYGPVNNPFDTHHIAGGSSGGAAAAVAGGLCLAAIASDTGGSIRQPASYCGLIGLKPSYGRVSRYGLIAYASSLDHIGILSRQVGDAALLLEVMAGYDSRDATSCREAVPRYSEKLKQQNDGKKRIVFFSNVLRQSELQAEIRVYIAQVIERLKDDGHTVTELDLPYWSYLLPVYYILAMAEASSNLARYDGVRYAHRNKNATSLKEFYEQTRSTGFGWEVKRRIMGGAFVLREGYYEAYYAKAKKIRQQIKQHASQIFNSHDFILMPVSQTTAPTHKHQYDNPLTSYAEDCFTVYANLTGLPAIALPAPRQADGLPYGLQYCAKSFDEAHLLAFANNFSKKQ